MSTTVIGIEILGFPKIGIERKTQKSFQILLSLCSSTRKAAQKKARSSKLTQELALLSCFYKLGTREFMWKGRLYDSGELFEKGRFLVPATLPENYGVCAVEAMWRTVHYGHHRRVIQRSNLGWLHMCFQNLEVVGMEIITSYICSFTWGVLGSAYLCSSWPPWPSFWPWPKSPCCPPCVRPSSRTSERDVNKIDQVLALTEPTFWWREKDREWTNK